MHLNGLRLHPEKYPHQKDYPFNLPVFQQPRTLAFTSPVTLFVGENGTGKSTLLQAITRLCGIYIWNGGYQRRLDPNPNEARFHHYLSVQWSDGPVPGAFFGSDLFHHFARVLDEWAATDPGQLAYFGGRSLTTLSHGQSLMAFFSSRCQTRGIYFLDEPETALSPRSQLALLEILAKAGKETQAQFLIATHSPLLLACPGACIYSFDSDVIQTIAYKDTDHYRIYRRFMNDPATYLGSE